MTQKCVGEPPRGVLNVEKTPLSVIIGCKSYSLFVGFATADIVRLVVAQKWVGDTPRGVLEVENTSIVYKWLQKLIIICWYY